MNTITMDQSGTTNVLVVDDNEAFRLSLAEFVDHQEGFHVIGKAKDGTEAILMTQSIQPDLILMDISMPRISGLAAALYMKQRSPNTKVVFITIHEDKTYQELAELVHVDGYVCKSALKEQLPPMLEKMRGTGVEKIEVIH
jgi:YesN/AraC family two-component response regulator